MYDKKLHGRVEVGLHSFLNSALDEGEWLASRTNWFSPEERTPPPRVNLNRILVGPRNRCGPFGEEDNLVHWLESYSSSPVVNLAA